MGDLNIEVNEKIKVKDEVKTSIEELWDSTSLTLLGIITSVVLTVFFGSWSISQQLLLGFLWALESFLIIFLLIKNKTSKSLLIKFSRSLTVVTRSQEILGKARIAPLSDLSQTEKRRKKK